MAARHKLETEYGLTAHELLQAVDQRFRLKVALEGGVAEVHMEKHIQALVSTEVDRYEVHDIDGHPDFSIWIEGRRKPLLAECKNIRESSAEGGEGYRQGGKVVAYKVETQKTRAATSDPSSRLYGVDQFEILGVCLGKKTGDWSDFLFVRSSDLQRHRNHPDKFATMQRVPLPGSSDLSPWYNDLGTLLKTI